jgi:hypothetical protein
MKFASQLLFPLPSLARGLGISRTVACESGEIEIQLKQAALPIGAGDWTGWKTFDA